MRGEFGGNKGSKNNCNGKSKNKSRSFAVNGEIRAMAAVRMTLLCLCTTFLLVPGSLGPLFPALLQQLHQVRLLGQKRIVAVVADHLAVVYRDAGGADGFGEMLYIGQGEKPVGADAD